MSKYPLVMIVGKSGTGKSTAIRNINSPTTVVFNTENKALPFPSKVQEVNITDEDPAKLIGYMKNFKNNDKYQVAVIDSLTKWSALILNRSEEDLVKKNDYMSPYRDNKKYIYQLFEACKQSGKPVFIIARDEITSLHTGETVKAAKVEGKAWSKGECEAEATVVLFTGVNKIDGKLNYYFETQSDGASTAKSPMGMFDDLQVPNDINYVIEKINSYYAK